MPDAIPSYWILENFNDGLGAAMDWEMSPTPKTEITRAKTPAPCSVDRRFVHKAGSRIQPMTFEDIREK